MGKIADKYLIVDPWAVVEKDFDKDRNRVSESIFSLGNEYMGVRGFFDEGYSGDSLVGSYFNGIYEEIPVTAHYKGIIKSLRFMVNAVNWLSTKIIAGNEQLDLAKSKISNFYRKLDFKTGVYTRSFDWQLESGQTIQMCFERIVSMSVSNQAVQRMTFKSVDYAGEITLDVGLDFNTIHEDQGKAFWNLIEAKQTNNWLYGLAETTGVGNRLYSAMKQFTTCHTIKTSSVETTKGYIGTKRVFDLAVGQCEVFDKIVINKAAIHHTCSNEELEQAGLELCKQYEAVTYESIFKDQYAFWSNVWNVSDITIDGDVENQQGIRYCIFQLYQTYRGENPGFNIGAKGLTGEAYRGLAFWDTETYCLPFYLFNNPKAARSLLTFRYQSLDNAINRAKDIGCEGAFYPIATIDGTESCDLWQHSNLQLQVGTAVGYGIWHYCKLTNDKDFLYEEGIEMLLQISRFNASRGQWGQTSGKYGFFGVMGPDEFQLMVNNNCYLNFMAKKMFEYSIEVYEEMLQSCPDQLSKVMEKSGVTQEEIMHWGTLAENMQIPQDESTKIFEQHDGFFNMPHIDIHQIPVEHFPLYHHWSYDKLYRYDMVKQPDVLMFMFLYSTQFTKEQKQANYDYYESRCIHESSLSPSIHSIMAAELGKQEEAYRFFEFATRLDLDNYNRNTREGLHTTSIAAAWMNIVYGFGGLRSDGEVLQLSPTLPTYWTGYSFSFQQHHTVIKVAVKNDEVSITICGTTPVELRVYNQKVVIDQQGYYVPIQNLTNV